jgi:quinolinate synthase
MLRLQPPLPASYTSAGLDALHERIATAKSTLGARLLILGHHYQRDEVMRWADARGDSFGLSRIAAADRAAELIVFCGVHFMAESADILTSAEQAVLLPDLNAGCSMADMADVESVEEAWESLAEVTDIGAIVPITYMNSSAALKAFVGRRGGAVCTSSNARAVVTWALGGGPDTKVLFFPDQHLGRNTAFQLGFGPADTAVWDPRRTLGGLDDRVVKEARFLLWKGHCSVHQRFRPEHVAAFRAAHPAGRVLVHPECSHDVVALADEVGSTDHIIAAVNAAAAGTAIGIATEIHLVQRLAAEHPDLTISSLDPLICPCSTMFRIDAAHLCWVLEHLVAGDVVNLQRMLDIT